MDERKKLCYDSLWSGETPAIAQAKSGLSQSQVYRVKVVVDADLATAGKQTTIYSADKRVNLEARQTLDELKKLTGSPNAAEAIARIKWLLPLISRGQKLFGKTKTGATKWRDQQTDEMDEILVGVEADARAFFKKLGVKVEEGSEQ